MLKILEQIVAGPVTQLALDLCRRPRVLSYGGGLDSWSMLLDAVARSELPDVCVFIDVGNGTRTRDSTVPAEWPGTYQRIREVVIPLCERVGVPFEWIDTEHYPVRDASSLYEWMHARKQIPVSGPDRICTIVAKVERFERWLTDTFPGQEVETWIGFDAAELDRVKKDPNAGKRRPRKLRPGDARRRNRFPLIERNLCRCRCEALARASGLPIPRKSACTTCCYNRLADWQRVDRELPRDFAMARELEARRRETETKNGFLLSIADIAAGAVPSGPVMSWCM